MTVDVLLVPVLLPLAAGVLILIIPAPLRRLRELLAFLAAAAAFAAALRIFPLREAGLDLPLLAVRGFTLRLALRVTALNRFILLFASGFGVLICLYSPAERGRSAAGGYYAFVLFALGGSSGVLLADHLLLLLIFWEIVTASLYFLVAGGGPEAGAGATKTFAMLGGADGCLLLGIGLLWTVSGSFTLSAIRLPASGALPTLAFLLMLAGALAKAGALPLHTWIPAASAGAPAPVMALLPAALDKLLGIYLLLLIATRLFVLTSALGLVLMIIGAVTVIAGVMVAMVQHDLRRLLAYHAVSQVGYMVLGIGTLHPLGLAGGLFHMLNNSIYKSCLFLCAGAVEKKGGSYELDDLGGLAAAMPVTFGACLVSALAISGIPPFNGFVSKWLVYQGLIEGGGRAAFVFLIAAMFGSALTLASFIKVVFAVFLGQTSRLTRRIKGEAPLLMRLPLMILALLSLAFGVFYRFPLSAFIAPALGLKLSVAGVWQSTLATGLILAGLIAGLLVYLAGRVARSARRDAAYIGGEPVKEMRVSGSHFYDAVRALPALRSFYRLQEAGRTDIAVWIGALGAAVSSLLRRLHGGFLPFYLLWSVLGVVLLCALVVM